jgi:hypothetical protein
MAYRTIARYILGVSIVVWLFTLFVAANVGYYVYIHEPQVQAMKERNAALCAVNHALANDVHSLILTIEELDGTLSDYLARYRIAPGSTCG